MPIMWLEPGTSRAHVNMFTALFHVADIYKYLLPLIWLSGNKSMHGTPLISTQNNIEKINNEICKLIKHITQNYIFISRVYFIKGNLHY